MYVSVYVHAHVYVCIYIYECMHMYTCNKCVIENMTYCYICDEIQYDAVTARSVFSKHSRDRHTIVCPHGQDVGCLLPVKSLISYSVSITAVLHKIWDLYSTALWRHSAVFTNCTALNGKSSCSRQEREICTENIAEKMQWNILKELKSENVSPWLCLMIYNGSLINFLASNPELSCICRTVPVCIITDASL